MKTAGRRRGKYSQSVRVFKMLDRLKGRRFGRSLESLAQEFSISERQVRRDLDVLAEAGHSLEPTTVDAKTGVALVQSEPTQLRLSIRERFTLLATRRVFDVMKNTPLYEDIQSIYEKIVSTLPDGQQADLEQFGGRFLFVPDHGTKIYRDKDDVLDALLTGVIRRWKIKCRYRPSKGRAKDGILAPYALVLYKNGLYVIGQREGPETDSAPHVYAAERFIDAEYMRGATFDIPENFQVDAFFSGAFGLHHGSSRKKVTIEFEADAKTLIQSRIWHESQTIIGTSGDKIQLSFHASDITQITSWVLSWGPLARVIEPIELADKVQHELQEAIKRYD